MIYNYLKRVKINFVLKLGTFCLNQDIFEYVKNTLFSQSFRY